MKHLTITLFLIFSSQLLFAQNRRFERGGGSNSEQEEQSSSKASSTSAEQKTTNFWDKVVFGGTAAAQFGTNTLVLVSPTVGYMLTKDYMIGTGFLYQYQSLATRNPVTGQVRRGVVKTSTYGPLLFNYYTIGNVAYVGAQFEYLNHDLIVYNNRTGEFDLDRMWTPVLFLEGGYFQSFGSKGGVRLGIRYNVLHQDGRSPYGSPWFPVIGFFF